MEAIFNSCATTGQTGPCILAGAIVIAITIAVCVYLVCMFR